MPSIINQIKQQLKANRNVENAAGMDKYFKGVLKFHGIKVPQLKQIFSDIYKQHIAPKDISQQIDLAYQLIESNYGEEKKFGVMLLRKNLKHLTAEHITQIGIVIENHVNDWATCDGLAGSLIGRMIRTDPTVAKSTESWKHSSNIWLQRSSCLVYLPVARFGKHNDPIIKTAKVCIKNDERFVQLGVGWILRELSLADLNLTVDFIKTNYKHFSREGLRYAIEKMKPPLRQELLEYGKK